MRSIAATVFSLVFALTRPLAAADNQPLPPGKPAGLAEAQMNNHQLFIYITVGGAVATMAAALLLIKKTKTSTAAAATTSTAS